MKKALIILAAILLLAGCALNNIVSTTKTFTDETFNVTFKYPSDWEILGGPGESNDHAINLISNENQNFYFDYKYDNDISKKEIEEKTKISIEKFQNEGKNTTLGNYPAKEIGMHGGIKYLIEIDGQFLLVNSEFYLTEEQEKGLQIILDSITF
jgi:hypothetical protein